MPRGIRYSEEFKRDAVAQITERGYGTVKLTLHPLKYAT